MAEDNLLGRKSLARRPPVDHAEAFQAYLTMGIKRTYSEVARKYDISREQVAEWAARHSWRRKVKKLDKTLFRAHRNRLEFNRRQVDARNFNELEKLRRKCMDAIERLDFKDADQATKALALTMRLQQDIIDAQPHEQQEDGRMAEAKSHAELVRSLISGVNRMAPKPVKTIDVPAKEE